MSLEFLARQMARIQTDVGGLREDMQVLTSIVLRQDATLTALLGEVRAVHGQIGRPGNRVQALESK